MLLFFGMRRAIGRASSGDRTAGLADGLLSPITHSKSATVNREVVAECMSYEKFPMPSRNGIRTILKVPFAHNAARANRQGPGISQGEKQLKERMDCYCFTGDMSNSCVIRPVS